MNGSEMVLVRHGQTEWSSVGRHTGRTDIPLTDLGREQAKALRAMLADHTFGRVWSSPSTRARETMELAGFAEGAEVDDDLLEWDYGEYEGRTTEQTRVEIPGWSVWTHPIVGGESVEDVGRRADRVIASAREAGGTTLLFAHAHLLRILTARWIGLPPTGGRSFRMGTATVSLLGWERENPVLLQWNEECHLQSLDPVL